MVINYFLSMSFTIYIWHFFTSLNYFLFQTYSYILSAYQFLDYSYLFIYLGTISYHSNLVSLYGTRNSKPLAPTSTTKIAATKGFFGFSLALFVNFVFICHLLKFIRNFLTSLLQDSYKIFSTFSTMRGNTSLGWFMNWQLGVATQDNVGWENPN